MKRLFDQFCRLLRLTDDEEAFSTQNFFSGADTPHGTSSSTDGESDGHGSHVVDVGLDLESARGGGRAIRFDAVEDVDREALRLTEAASLAPNVGDWETFFSSVFMAPVEYTFKCGLELVGHGLVWNSTVARVESENATPAPNVNFWPLGFSIVNYSTTSPWPVLVAIDGEEACTVLRGGQRGFTEDGFDLFQTLSGRLRICRSGLGSAISGLDRLKMERMRYQQPPAEAQAQAQAQVQAQAPPLVSSSTSSSSFSPAPFAGTDGEDVVTAPEEEAREASDVKGDVAESCAVMVENANADDGSADVLVSRTLASSFLLVSAYCPSTPDAVSSIFANYTDGAFRIPADFWKKLLADAPSQLRSFENVKQLINEMRFQIIMPPGYVQEDASTYKLNLVLKLIYVFSVADEKDGGKEERGGKKEEEDEEEEEEEEKENAEEGCENV